jgi:hypothetical protein
MWGKKGGTMSNPLLAIAVAHDGVAQDRNGKNRVAFEELLRVLLDSHQVPATLCFYAEGVRWLTHESPVIEELRQIGERGADIVVCRTCLAEAGLLDDAILGRMDSEDHIEDILRHAEHAMVL